MVYDFSENMIYDFVFRFCIYIIRMCYVFTYNFADSYLAFRIQFSVVFLRCSFIEYAFRNVFLIFSDQRTS